jgi:uncharacterized protein YeaO (DUF488 family)
VGLGRTTRFAPLPRGARRVSVMRGGTAGLKALAPSAELLAAFQAEKRALLVGGAPADRAHAAAARGIGYRRRFRREIRSSPAAMASLRDLVRESRSRDLYLMCMCPWRTPGRACHTYLLLELAREVDRGVRLLSEPAPRRTSGRPRATPRRPGPAARG